MRKYRSQIVLGLMLALGIYIVVLLFADSQGQLSGEGVLEQIALFPLGLIIPLVVLQIFVIIFRFIEWHYYLGCHWCAP